MSNAATPRKRGAPAPFDRRAIMTDAHAQYRTMGRFGWDWPRCLRFAWVKAHERRRLAIRAHEMVQTKRSKWRRYLPIDAALVERPYAGRGG